MASSWSVSDADCGRRLGHASWGVSVAGIIVTVVTVVIVVTVLVTAANHCPVDHYHGYCYYN